MKIVAWILAIYPRRWRERYQEEMLALLEQHTITFKTIFDLLVSAIDAQCDPNYKSQESYMFQRLHDIRFLSYVYVSALAIFLVAINCWSLSISQLNASNNTSFLANAAPVGITIIGPVVTMIISTVTLLCSSALTFRDALKHRRIGTILFASLCLILSLFLVLAFTRISYGWILDAILVMILSLSFFITGVKGVKMLTAHRITPILFALLIDLVVPAILLMYEGMGLAAGLDASRTWLQFIIYLPLGTLVLFLADVPRDRQSWGTIQGLGGFCGLLVAIEFAIVIIWDINCWIVSGPNATLGTTYTIGQFFGGEYIGILIVNAIILIGMLLLIALALFRTFMIGLENREITAETLAR